MALSELTIEFGNVLETRADVLIIPVDGTFVPRPRQYDRLLGNIGAQFLRRFPDPEVLEDPEAQHWLLEEIESQVDLPLQLGQAALVELPEEAPFRYAALVSILDHRGKLEPSGKRNVLAAAFTAALDQCEKASLETIATAVLHGGWRLPREEAATVMFGQLANRKTPAVRLIIRTLEQDWLDEYRKLAAARGLSSKTSDPRSRRA